MVGYPKNLNTKADYLYVKDNFDKSFWEKDFRDLIESSKDWFFVSYFSNKEDGIEDTTHKFTENKSMDNESVEVGKEFSQYEYKLNPYSKLVTLGFTEEEILSYLK